MKIKLFCREKNRQVLEEMLKRGGFEISNSQEAYALYEHDYQAEYLIGRKGDDIVMVFNEDIVLIESFSHNIVIRTLAEEFKTTDTLTELENILPQQFIRINQSTIINKKMIKKINVGFSMRYDLTMKNSMCVTVTRTYFQSFKDKIGF